MPFILWQRYALFQKVCIAFICHQKCIWMAICHTYCHNKCIVCISATSVKKCEQYSYVTTSVYATYFGTKICIVNILIGWPRFFTNICRKCAFHTFCGKGLCEACFVQNIFKACIFQHKCAQDLFLHKICAGLTFGTKIWACILHKMCAWMYLTPKVYVTHIFATKMCLGLVFTQNVCRTCIWHKKTAFYPQVYVICVTEMSIWYVFCAKLSSQKLWIAFICHQSVYATYFSHKKCALYTILTCWTYLGLVGLYLAKNGHSS